MSLLNPEIKNVLQQITDRTKDEKSAENANKLKLLAKLKLSIKSLPEQSIKILNTAASYQNITEMNRLDRITLSIWYSDFMLQEMKYESDAFNLKEKNNELDKRIASCRKETATLKSELEAARKHLAQTGDIMIEKDSVQHKIVSYQKNLAKAKSRFADLKVPSGTHFPKTIDALIKEYKDLKKEEILLKDKAERIKLAKEAKIELLKLKGIQF